MPDYGKYRAAVQISNNDVIKTVKQTCPKFSKIQCSMVNNPAYGVQLTSEAEQALVEEYGYADGLSLKRRKKSEVKRVKTHRLSVRLDDASYDMVKNKMQQNGSESAQQFLENLLLDAVKEDT